MNYFAGEFPKDQPLSKKELDRQYEMRLDREFEENREYIRSVYNQLKDAGYVDVGNSEESFASLPPGELIVRRENIGRLLSTVEKNQPYTISFDQTVPGAQHGGKYFNAASFTRSDRRGLTAAFTEGFSKEKGLALAVGIMPSDHLQVSHLPDNPEFFISHKDQGGILDRTQNKAIEGQVFPDDIAFIILRFPVHAAPAELLSEHDEERLAEFTDDYIDKKGKFSDLKIQETARVLVNKKAIEAHMAAAAEVDIKKAA